MSWFEDVQRIGAKMDDLEERTGLLFDDPRFTRIMIGKARRLKSLAAAHHDPAIMRAALDSYLSLLDPEISDAIERHIVDLMEEESHAST